MKKFIAITLAVLTLFSVMVFTAAAEDEVVARMWFCSEISKNTGIGHTFLYFENLTDHPIMVGRYEVAPYEDVSVGTFGTEGPRGGGLYYNNEQDLTHYHSLLGVSEELTAGELQSVTDKIKNYSHWDVFKNCYYFASMGWNAGADNDIPFLLIPGFARLIMQIRGAQKNFVDLFSQNDPVYKQSELPG